MRGRHRPGSGGLGSDGRRRRADGVSTSPGALLSSFLSNPVEAAVKSAVLLLRLLQREERRSHGVNPPAGQRAPGSGNIPRWEQEVLEEHKHEWWLRKMPPPLAPPR